MASHGSHSNELSAMTVNHRGDADPDHNNEPRLTSMEELVKLMRTQTELTERLLAKTEERVGNVAATPPPSSSVAEELSREILDVLRRIDERQSTAGMYMVVFLIMRTLALSMAHRRVKTTNHSSSCNECSCLVSVASFTFGPHPAHGRSMERNT